MRTTLLQLKITAGMVFIAMLNFSAAAAANEDVCRGLSGLVDAKAAVRYTNPAREPNKAETALVKMAKLEIFEINDYSQGTKIVDADNDGIQDFFVWNIQGSGRFLSAEVHGIDTSSINAKKLLLKVDLGGLGSLLEPRFVRYQGLNYLIVSDGRTDSLRAMQLVQNNDKKFDLRTVCEAQTNLKPVTKCRHPACQKLASEINNPKENQSFRQYEWPHKYTSPAGMNIFYYEENEPSDFDNTKSPDKVWRLGREGYYYHYIYWNLLGLGEDKPLVPPVQKAAMENERKAQVVQGKAHDRLRRALEQQSKVLSKELGKEISLPSVGQFFLFEASDRIYWAWDFEEPPFGKEMHITYTKGRKSDYIGSIGIKRTWSLIPCISKCTNLKGK